ncbi:hypothetical protein HN451_01640 [archaeon]|jgi:stage II sporulation protein M|nr:hypothetical protein [archaeon]
MVKKKKSSKKIVKINNNDSFIYKNFLFAVKDLKKLKTYFWVSFWLFFGIALFGFLFPVFFVEDVLKIIEELIRQTDGLGFLGMIRFIMVNNIQSAFLGMALGIFLAIPPLGIIISNGYILGLVARLTVDETSIFILWRLLPHGIFEIPAILIAVALGLRLGILFMHEVIKSNNSDIETIGEVFIMLFSALFWFISVFIYLAITFSHKNLKKKLWANVKNSFRIFILIVVPLLVIAGVIEGILIGLVG